MVQSDNIMIIMGIRWSGSFLLINLIKCTYEIHFHSWPYDLYIVMWYSPSWRQKVLVNFKHAKVGI